MKSTMITWREPQDWGRIAVAPTSLIAIVLQTRPNFIGLAEEPPHRFTVLMLDSEFAARVRAWAEIPLPVRVP